MRDARLELLRRALATRSALRIPREPHHGEAAVTLLLRPADQLEILLIKRAERDADPWSGHMALPGGRRSGADPDLMHTAFRETEEETGVAVGAVGELLGSLDDVVPGSVRLPPIVITPFVASVPGGTPLSPDAREVDAALWVPLPALLEPGAVSEILIELTEGHRAFPSLQFGEYVIWGLTHRILVQFLDVVRVSGVVG